MKKKFKFLGAGILLISCLAASVFMSNRNYQLLGVSNVESLTAGDSFDDYYMPNSHRASAGYTYRGGADWIVTHFYFHGTKQEAAWVPTSGVAYCCFSGTTHQCKPSGDNNTAWACAYFNIGAKFWD